MRVPLPAREAVAEFVGSAGLVRISSDAAVVPHGGTS
jgi:hypothetical protein